MNSCYNTNMGYNNSDNRQSGRRNFGRRDFGSPGGVRQMHKTVCSSCGRDCEVPFRPSGDKPVFCSNCFEKNREGSDTRRFEDRNFRKPHFEDRDNRPPQNSEQYNDLNAKLDKILAILTSDSLLKVAPTPKPQVVEKAKIPQDLPLPSENPVIIVEKKKKTPKKSRIASGNIRAKK